MKKTQIFTIFLLIKTTLFNAYPAVAIVPVADLLGGSLQKQFPGKNADELYKNLPLCGSKKSMFAACSRLHQLLFNEVVEVVEEYKDEIRVTLPNVFYITHNSKKPQSTYWTHKKNVRPLKILANNGLNLHNLPKPISFKKNNITKVNNQHVVTLIEPWHNHKSKKTFSVGTRFVTSSHNAHSYKAFVFDSKRNRFNSMSIPKKNCLNTQQLSNNEKIKIFVQLLKKWTHAHGGYIPYVLGGCSFTHDCTTKNFTEHASKKSSWFAIDNFNHTPLPGFDCTGLVARAAQACNIPYFFKNTTTLAHYLQPVTQKTGIKEGDLIWIAGHVMAVANKKKNTLIEARGYGHGFGKIQEMPLNKMFEGVNTYEQLLTAFIKKKPLKILDNKQKVRKTFPTFKLLQMKSVWS